MALKLYSSSDKFRQGENVPDSPTRHRIGLGYRTRDDDVILEIGPGGNGKRLPAVIEKVRVALVGKKEYVLPGAQLGDASKFRVIENGAAGIVRRVHDNHS